MHLGVTERKSKVKRTDFRVSKNENVMYQNLWDTAKEKFIVLDISVKKRRKVLNIL